MGTTKTDRSIIVDNLFEAKRMKQRKIMQMREEEMKKKMKARKKMASTKVNKKRINPNINRINNSLFGNLFPR